MSAALDNETGIDLSQYTADLGRAARAAAAELAHAQPQAKNRALLEIAAVLDQQRATILQENKKDLAAAGDNEVSAAMLERLELNPARIDAMIEGLQQVAGLPDPVGEISELRYSGRQDACAAWGHWDHLRVASKRNRGCRRVMSQVR
jgi:glutamate-5-semialdehyde dehydrogenase